MRTETVPGLISGSTVIGVVSYGIYRSDSLALWLTSAGLLLSFLMAFGNFSMESDNDWHVDFSILQVINPLYPSGNIRENIARIGLVAFIALLNWLYFILPVMLVSYIVLGFVGHGYDALVQVSRNGSITVIGSLLLVAISLAAFIFRLYFRATFGIVESMFGVAIIVHRLENLPPSGLIDADFVIPILSAGVFLVVRGLDNFQQGFQSDLLVLQAKRRLGRNRKPR